MERSKPVPLAAHYLSPIDVRSLVQAARKTKADLVTLVTNLESQVQARRETLSGHLASLDVKDRLRALDNTVSALKGELKAKTNPQRTVLVRQAQAHKDVAVRARPLYESAVAMLMRDTIGHDKRSAYLHHLEGSGPQELKSFAALAVATKDHALAAAVCCKLNLLPARERPVSPKEIAEALMGELHRELMLGLMEVERLAYEVAVIDRMFESNHSSMPAQDVVKLGLMQKRERAFAEGVRSNA